MNYQRGSNNVSMSDQTFNHDADIKRQNILEKASLELLEERSKTEQKYFDIALSGTSATLVFQLPNKL